MLAQLADLCLIEPELNLEVVEDTLGGAHATSTFTAATSTPDPRLVVRAILPRAACKGTSRHMSTAPKVELELAFDSLYPFPSLRICSAPYPNHPMVDPRLGMVLPMHARVKASVGSSTESSTKSEDMAEQEPMTEGTLRVR
eukprot:SAG31_NODE_11507_length_1022_cov_1.881907_1_plen_141_part_10